MFKNLRQKAFRSHPADRGPPSLVAIGAAAGFINFYKADEMSQLLKLEGFRRGKIF